MKKILMPDIITDNISIVYRNTITALSSLLISVLVMACDLTDLRDVGSRDKWWQYTRIGSDFADDLVGISSVIVIALMVLFALYGSVSHILLRRKRWDVLRFGGPVAIGGFGFAVIRGLFQHWAWWIVRWEEASIIRDFLFGTLMFILAGVIGGVFIGAIVSIAVILVSCPILYPIRWVVDKRSHKDAPNYKT